MKILSDEQLSQVIQQDSTKWAVIGNRAFLLDLAKAIAQAQAIATAREIFEEFQSTSLYIGKSKCGAHLEEYYVIGKAEYQALKSRYTKEA